MRQILRNDYKMLIDSTEKEIKYKKVQNSINFKLSAKRFVEKMG